MDTLYNSISEAIVPHPTLQIHKVERDLVFSLPFLYIYIYIYHN